MYVDDGKQCGLKASSLLPGQICCDCSTKNPNPVNRCYQHRANQNSEDELANFDISTNASISILESTATAGICQGTGEEEGAKCQKPLNWGEPGNSTRTHCKDCARAVNAKRISEKGDDIDETLLLENKNTKCQGTGEEDGAKCQKQSSWGEPGKLKRTHCAPCARAVNAKRISEKGDDIDATLLLEDKNTKCEIKGCQLSASFGLELYRPLRCFSHGHPVGMINVTVPLCERCPENCKAYGYFKVTDKTLGVFNIRLCSVCLTCHFPDHESAIKQKTKGVKERIVVKSIIHHIKMPGVFFIHDMSLDEVVFRKIYLDPCFGSTDNNNRRRIDLRAYIKTANDKIVLLAIEIDEKQHKDKKYAEDDPQRYRDILGQFGSKILFLRMNPDKYKTNGKKYLGFFKNDDHKLDSNPDVIKQRCDEFVIIVQETIEEIQRSEIPDTISDDELLEVRYYFYDGYVTKSRTSNT